MMTRDARLVLTAKRRRAAYNTTIVLQVLDYSMARQDIAHNLSDI